MSPWELLASFTLAGLTVVSVSAAAILVYSLATGARYALNVTTALATTLMLLVAALFTLGFGLLLAPLARSQEAAMALVNIIAFPVMFAGGIIVPSFILPPILKKFASIYPLSRLLEAVRSLLLYGISVKEAIIMALPAIIATVIVYGVGLAVFVRLLERAIEE
jgi:ABC-2 type transport system permease protein